MNILPHAFNNKMKNEVVPLLEKKGSRQTSDINNRYLYLQDSSEKQNRKTLYIIELSPMITEDCGASKLESEES